MYEVLYTEAKRGNYDIVMCDFCLSDGINLIKNCESNCSEDKLVLLGSLLSGKVHGSLCTKLARSSLYNEDFIYPEDNMREDLCCVIQLVYNANSVKYLPIPMYHYFINEASICNVVTFDQVYKKYKQSCNNSNKIFTFLQNNNLMDKYKKELIVLKLCIKEELCKIAKGEKGRKVWKEAFPEVGIINTLFSAIPFRMKLKILLTNCRLYPLLIYVL